MKIKNQEWKNFKKTIISFIKVFEEESIRFDYPLEDEEDFRMLVEDCVVNPVFTKRDDFLKVEYDFTFCQTKIRTLSFSKYRESARVEITLKENFNNNG
jgi:hypothetical protein